MYCTLFPVIIAAVSKTHALIESNVLQSMLFVEVPSYRDTSVCHAVKVNFCVINGKRKRSQPQHFTYAPLAGRNAAQPLRSVIVLLNVKIIIVVRDLPVSIYRLLFDFLTAPSIKTEPLDEFEADHMGFAIPQILGLPTHSYYHNQRGVLHPDNGMASCQRLSSSLPSQDTRFQQQSPAIVYSRGGKSLSGSPSLYQQAGGMMPDPHRSVLVHTGCPAQPVGPIGVVQHPSIIQFSPTNHHQALAQPESHQVVYCDGYSPQAAAAHSPTPPQAHAAVTHPQHYPTVIQQQPYVQKAQHKGRAPTGPMEAAGDGQRRVTVKEENLDQAYLDDGECKLRLLYPVLVCL